MPGMAELKVIAVPFGIKGNSVVPKLPLCMREMKLKLLILFSSLPPCSLYSPCSTFLSAFPVVTDSIYTRIIHSHCRGKSGMLFSGCPC